MVLHNGWRILTSHTKWSRLPLLLPHQVKLWTVVQSSCHKLNAQRLSIAIFLTTITSQPNTIFGKKQKTSFPTVLYEIHNEPLCASSPLSPLSKNTSSVKKDRTAQEKVERSETKDTKDCKSAFIWLIIKQDRTLLPVRLTAERGGKSIIDKL